jgi:hypothetical protein
LDYLATHASLGFVNYKKRCTRPAAASDKVYQLFAHGRWITPASSTTKTGRHDILLDEILLKVALSTKNQFIYIILRKDYDKKITHINLEQPYPEKKKHFRVEKQIEIGQILPHL